MTRDFSHCELCAALVRFLGQHVETLSPGLTAAVTTAADGIVAAVDAEEDERREEPR